MLRCWIPVVLGASVLLAACSTSAPPPAPVSAQPPPVAAAPSDPRRRASVRLQLAASYFAQRDFRIALEEAQLAVQADPTLADAHALLALVHAELDQRAEAEASFGRALRLAPDSPEIANNYGWFLCRTGRSREAMTQFDRAVSNRMYATPALALLNAGVCLLDQRDLRGAEGYLRRAFELDAASPMIKYQLARVYLALGELERAGFYYGLLDASLAPTAETLWLGIRVARARGDGRTERVLGEDLLRRFAGTPEAARLRRGAYDD